ncbi:MAG: hypothetical protein JKX99_00975 [Robiginitomaculum sp.]|nr:hypothetical protein [Robiginitomaculum sp.]
MQEILSFFSGTAVQALVSLSTVIALIFALLQTYQSKKHERVLRDLSGSVSTILVASFPDHLLHIASMIERAEKSLHLLVAFPEQAYFSNPDGYLKYESAVNGALRNPKIYVRMIFADKDYRLLSDRRQFRDAGADWGSWKKKHYDNLNRYMDGHRSTAKKMGLITPNDIKDSENWHLFQEACEQVAIERWRDMDGRAEIVEVDTFMPMSIWIVDGVETMFLISGQDEVVGHAVKTSDLGLSAALMSLQNRYYRNYPKGKNDG